MEKTATSSNPPIRVGSGNDLAPVRPSPFFKPVVQPKLTVNQPGDEYEQEADAVADSVMRLKDVVAEAPFFKPSIAAVQRKCQHCEEETGVQRKEMKDDGVDVSAQTENHIASPSGGRRLTETERGFFEPKMGHDFSHVKVHTGADAAASAQSINALAYTTGENIVFGQGQFAPDTATGKRLLAHELTHVVQQSNKIGTKRIQRVQLSYDDGPDNAGNTRAVLTALNSAGARATFYVVGQRVLEGNNYRVVFDIAASGNWLGNHAFDWNNERDNHVFMHGTMEERTLKILETEVAVRSALIRGRQEAQAANRWNSIPQPNRDYIEDVIASGTGRFRTPGFRSHIYSPGGITQRAALSLVNRIATAVGIRQFAVSDSVDVDPEDWRSGRTAAETTSRVRSDLDENSDSILLHSRVAATAAATPAIVADIRGRSGYTFDPTSRGALERRLPPSGFAGLSTISNPPTHDEIMAARGFLMAHLSAGGIILGETAIGILQMAQAAGTTEAGDFLNFIETTPGPPGTGFMANFLLQNAGFRITYLYLLYSSGRRPLPPDYQAGGRPAGR